MTNTTQYTIEAKEDFDTKTLPWLTLHGKKIGDEANKGNEEAKKVMEAYQLLHIRFEQAAYSILCAAIERYKKSMTKSLFKIMFADLSEEKQAEYLTKTKLLQSEISTTVPITEIEIDPDDFMTYEQFFAVVENL